MRIFTFLKGPPFEHLQVATCMWIFKKQINKILCYTLIHMFLQLKQLIKIILCNIVRIWVIIKIGSPVWLLSLVPSFFRRMCCLSLTNHNALCYFSTNPNHLRCLSLTNPNKSTTYYNNWWLLLSFNFSRPSYLYLTYYLIYIQKYAIQLLFFCYI